MSPAHRHPDADLPTRRIPFLQLRSLILSLIAEDDAEDDDDGPDTIDDLGQDFEELPPAGLLRPHGVGAPIQAVPELPRVNTLDALVAELRSVYGGPRAQGSTAAPLQPPPPVPPQSPVAAASLPHPAPPRPHQPALAHHSRVDALPPTAPPGQGSRVEPLPPRHRTHHSRVDAVPPPPRARSHPEHATVFARGSQPVSAMAPPRVARGSSPCVEESRPRRRSQAELTPAAFPVVAVARSVPSDFAEPSGVGAPARRSQSRAERMTHALPPPSTSVRPPSPVVGAPAAPARPRRDRTEPSNAAPFPDAEGSRVGGSKIEQLTDQTHRDRRSRR